MWVWEWVNKQTSSLLEYVASGSASRGLYRVHQFSKVEMFVLCTPQQSEALLEELADIEKEMFTELGLHFKILVRHACMLSAL